MTRQRSRGAFVAVEGLDGAGTTTQVRLLSAHLRGLGFQTLGTREPSAGGLGAAVRAAVEGDETMTPETMALAFAADRLHHMYKPGGIDSLLTDGVWVISDRYVLSSLAYQSAQGLDLDWVVELNKFAPTPDVTVFVDTPIRTCLSRIAQRGENVEDHFHKRASLINTRREYFHALALGRFVGKLVTADGSGSPRAVLSQILEGMVEELHADFGLLGGIAPSLESES